MDIEKIASEMVQKQVVVVAVTCSFFVLNQVKRPRCVPESRVDDQKIPYMSKTMRISAPCYASISPHVSFCTPELSRKDNGTY